MFRLIDCRCGLIGLVILVVGASSAVAQPVQPALEDLANDPELFLKTARTRLKWDEATEPAKLFGPVYFVGTKGLSVFLITTPEGHIIVNTGMPGSGPLIEKSIRKLGFKPEEIKIILTGHAHVDHAGGHAYLQKLSGGKIEIIHEEKDLFESGGKLDFHYGAVKEFEFEPAKVAVVFNDGDQINLGDVALTAILTNGHTRGSTTFVMKVTEDGKDYTVVFPNGTSVNPGYRLVKNPSYPGIADDFRRTLETLESLKPDIWLHPHNEAYRFNEKLARTADQGIKAWIDPDGYTKWVAAQRTAFETAMAREKGADSK